ncbi:ArsR/SmtB family transcription factor [Enterococcus nangangensis]|uniref:ArsR/SmtB family transcription factor n=1 Tax=Enterococcus nangangensis TaxID=2559926 RepID=UPI0010F669B6|nr:metalloregulator ArsR/SmtB family transcription factor [Enterococcus nangangensis]
MAEKYENTIQAIEKGFIACQPILTAIGDEVRQSILLTMMNNGTCEKGMRVVEITACTNLSRPAVSHHLKIMKDAGVVHMRKEGTMTFYTLNLSVYEPLKQLFLDIDSINCDKGE